MLFNSLGYLIFFTVVFLVFYGTATRYRWLLLLAASYFFYMSWNPSYILLIVLSTLIDYGSSLAMAATPSPSKRLGYLCLSLVSNLGLLFTFKYYNFFAGALSDLFGCQVLPGSRLLLPVGISFYTFQTLAYTIDVYRGTQVPERHLGRFALYVAFFPQLVAGPIERAGNLLSQLRCQSSFDYVRVVSGLRLILVGLIKKVVVADRLAIVVDRVYEDPSGYSGAAYTIATVFFAFQIYCDFSGYSDMAIGAARMLGIDLMKNFDRPYGARSIPEFWNRWHISLSTWFRDYVYIPLGGSRVALPRLYVNLMIVFLVSGLWHGANWTFLVWGAIHGSLMILHHVLKNPASVLVSAVTLDRWPSVLHAVQRVLTFFLVCFGWIFFRAASVGDACYICAHLTSGWATLLDAAGLVQRLTLWGGSWHELLLCGCLVGLVQLADALRINEQFVEGIPAWPSLGRWAVYYGAVLSVFALGVFGSSAFIYFQF